MATLKETYENQITQYSSDDQHWVQYVRDHFHYIRNTAQETILEIYRHNTMKYRLEDFLDEQLHFPKSAAWIVLLINQLNTNADFVGLNSILVPDMGVIQTLHTTFRTVRSQQQA